MKRGMVEGGAILLLLGLATVPARAQTAVEGGVVVRSGPVTGHVEVGSPAREPVREVIMIERAHVPHGNAHGWWRKHGYRAVTVYYDGSRYYGRRLERPGLRPVVVYERRGQYYLGDQDGGDEDGEPTRHQHHDKDEDGRSEK
jgi:hypothetical protein